MQLGKRDCHYIMVNIIDITSRVHPRSPTSWKWTLSHPLLTKCLLETLQFLVPFALKILRSQLMGMIPLWVILVAVITW